MITCPQCGADSPEGSRFCAACGARFGGIDAAKRKTVSIVFCDLVGSTDLGEHLDPEVLRAVLNRYFEAARSCMAAHGGTVEKYIGDAVVAVFGIPETHEDDALRALRAALELRNAVAALDADLQRDRGKRLRVRIGVSTGEVLADASSVATLVSGDAANLAARLEQVAPPGDILISEPTFQLTRGSIEVESVEPLTLKGKSHPVPAYRLSAIKSDAEAVQRSLSAPMIGRTRQLEAAMLAFDTAVEDSACTLLTILGTPGVGKSRLALEIGSSDDIATVGIALAVRAQVLAARGNHTEAVALARAAVETMGPSDMLWRVGELWAALGRVLDAGGQSDRAADAYGKAAGVWERKGARALLAQLPKVTP